MGEIEPEPVQGKQQKTPQGLNHGIAMQDKLAKWFSNLLRLAAEALTILK